MQRYVCSSLLPIARLRVDKRETERDSERYRERGGKREREGDSSCQLLIQHTHTHPHSHIHTPTYINIYSLRCVHTHMQQGNLSICKVPDTNGIVKGTRDQHRSSSSSPFSCLPRQRPTVQIHTYIHTCI